MAGTRKIDSVISHADFEITRKALVGCGAPFENVRLFKTNPDPTQVNYLDLSPTQGADSQVVLPDGVIESREKPLLYFVRNDALSAEAHSRRDQLRHLRRILGSRGERAFLAVVEPGVVRVIPVSLDAVSDNWQRFEPNTPEARSLFARMSLGEYSHDGMPKDADYVYNAMFDLLSEVANNIVADSSTLKRDDVLSLVGRALFLRFLKDRKIVTVDHLKAFVPGLKQFDDCLADATKAARTCKWLDETFNGDFLPLTRKGNAAWFQEIAPSGSKVFHHLSAILLNEEPQGGNYQKRLWSDFDFAHVPVGLLSQVYEGFVWKWDEIEAGETSVHYTPRTIANYLVDDAFDDIRKAGKARVLDPACGAGVFLVLSFRRLYLERWKKSKQRPQRGEIRDILNKQLRGFDISESALRLAALSLYLTAIELDPKPTPPHALRFKNLRNRVLFNCRANDDPPKGPVAGSLGARMLQRHRGRYQLVICNPPWTRLGEENQRLAATFHGIGRGLLNERGLSNIAATYRNPDNVPDIPFIWRAMQWCEPGGRMAFVLPTRLLFKQGDIGQRAREAIFKAVCVTGMLNCSNIADDTNVWPDMNQPFLLFFASNRVPKPDYSTRWITVHRDESLNDCGEFRVDSKSIEEVSVEQTFVEPWLWKALALGTALDLEIVRKVKRSAGIPLQKYWDDELKLLSTNGYSIKTKGQKDASFLIGLPNVTSSVPFRFMVDAKSLPSFAALTASRPRSRQYFRAPLVLIRGFPCVDRRKGRALLSLDDVAFNQSYHGFSGAGHPSGLLLVRYLHLLVHSDIWMHYALLTGPKLGAERREIYKEDIEKFLVIPLSDLSEDQKNTIDKLSERLISGDGGVFEEIDAFFANLYGLKARDMEVIRDTLSVELPFKSIRAHASRPPSAKLRREFCTRMEGILRPFFKRLGQTVAVRSADVLRVRQDCPFSVVTVTNEPQLELGLVDEIAPQVLELASTSGASMAILDAGVPRTLVVAMLNHARYWTPSRARLCAVRILNEGMGSFEE